VANRVPAFVSEPRVRRAWGLGRPNLRAVPVVAFLALWSGPGSAEPLQIEGEAEGPAAKGGLVVVDRRADGVTRLSLRQFGQPAAGGEDVTSGRRVFQLHCAMCHGQDATGMMGMHPSLRGSVERLSREGVEVAIRKGRKTTPPMPAWEGRLTDDQIADVIAYLGELPPGPRNFEPGGGGGMMDRMMDGGMSWMALLLVVLAAVLIASIFIVGGLWRRGERPGGSGSRALEVLRERYARGEIDYDEYEERRRKLGS
jgi:putative membrane protein